MREIKFRGKSKISDIGNIKRGTWIYGGITYDDDRVWIDMPYLGQILVDKETIGQYVGVKDKNGKEVYEGDIVEEVYFNPKIDEKERRYGKYIVKYKEDRGGYVPFACGDGCGCCEDEVVDAINSEIIGNIYDNPELLEKEGK